MSALSDALNAANVEGWSAREIARRSGGAISHSVVADYLGGRAPAEPRETVLEGFVKVFPRLTVPKLRELAGYPAGESEPYEPPDEAHRLDKRQRRAVDELIRLLAAKAGDGDVGRDAAPMNENVRELTKRERMQQPATKAARQDPKKKP